MDLKRSRDLDDDDSSPSGKRTRLEAQAAIASSSSNAMQAVAHEALAMTNGSAFSAVNSVASAASNSYTKSNDGGYSNHSSNSNNNSSSSTSNSISNSISNNIGNDANAANAASQNAAGSIISQAPLESMSDITRCFKNAVLTGWDRRSPTYASVDVLIVFWDEDDNDVKDAAAQLESVFRTKYHFATDVFAIQSAQSSAELYARVDRLFATSSAPGDLAILYYAGQIVANRQVGEAPVWTPRRKNSDAIIESRPIQAACENSSSDVLLLFDFCSAYHYPLAKASYGTARRNAIEVLDAPSQDPDLGSISFTRALAQELSVIPSDNPVSVEALHAQVSNRMTISTSIKPRGRGRPPKEPPVKAMAEQLHLPKHYWLFHRRSIVLAPQPDGPQVILCLRVLNGSLDVNQWGKWIYNATPEARDAVRIEGLYSGFSTMIVLRVPVVEWNAFSECPAGSFVGYSTIGNISPEIQEKIDNDLASKLWRGDVPSRLFYPSADLPETPLVPALSSPPAAVQDSTTSSSTAAPAPESSAVAADGGASGASGSYSLRTGQKRARKALPTERKILPSESPLSARRREYALSGDPSAHKPKETQYHHHQQIQQRGHRHSMDMGDMTEKDALMAAAAQKPFKISIKLAGQTHVCKECKAGFKDADSLQNHVRKQHTRPFHCVFNWAGCDSTFASKNEWKRHVMSQHILLQYWVCQVELCSKVANKVNGSGGNSYFLPNGAIFNRKDLFTQHLRRMHTPPHVKKLLKQAKQGSKTPNHPAIMEWENRLKELQQDGLKPRCQLPDYMICPAQGCGIDFHGNNAWDDRMEHVARHLEAAAAGREPPVIFGGKTDTTLTNWATRPEVGIAKRVGPNTWHLDNPLRPEIMAWTEDDPDQEQDLRQDVQREADLASGRERSRSVIEVADGDAAHDSVDMRRREDAEG